VEAMIVVVLFSLLMGILWGVYHFFFGGSSRNNMINLSRRNMLQQDAKSATRRLLYRLRESTQILTPTPGTASTEVVFRDITNADVRLRHIPEQKLVVSERMVGGAWVAEQKEEVVDTGTGTSLPVSWPVTIQNCVSIRFTAISPDCLTVQASLEMEGQITPLLTVIKLRNSGLAY
jgi:hypothetical protein